MESKCNILVYYYIMSIIILIILLVILFVEVYSDLNKFVPVTYLNVSYLSVKGSLIIVHLNRNKTADIYILALNKHFNFNYSYRLTIKESTLACYVSISNSASNHTNNMIGKQFQQPIQSHLRANVVLQTKGTNFHTMIHGNRLEVSHSQSCLKLEPNATNYV